MFGYFGLCRREDLNLQPLRDAILSRARIPIPPLRLILCHSGNVCILTEKPEKSILKLFYIWRIVVIW